MSNVYPGDGAGFDNYSVLNKVDLPAADIPPDKLLICWAVTKARLFAISAKTGQNVDGFWMRFVERIPKPVGEVDGPTRALIFDSYYDDYRGVILYVRSG